MQSEFYNLQLANLLTVECASCATNGHEVYREMLVIRFLVNDSNSINDVTTSQLTVSPVGGWYKL